MSEEDKDVAADINAEVKEDTNINETAEEAVSLEEVKALRVAKAQLTARAKKAEDKLKNIEANPQEINNPQLSDELKLIARGLSDEEIEQAKIVAKGKDINLTEAIKDPLFLTYQADLKEKERKEKAKLGASKGSGESEEQLTGTESGSKREDHIKAFKKLTGK